MNRTLRVLDSLARYKSWVNMKTGPTGRERLIYGAYEVYDTKDEKAAAEAALAAPPQLPELDDAVRAYIAANDAVAPVLDKAAGLDDYRAEHPRAFSGFASLPDGLLGRLRDVQQRLARTHGNLARAAGFDMTFIMSDYNTMVTMYGLPGQFKD